MTAVSNILYLTKNCNLNCSYCFESGKHINESISIEEIDMFVKNICEKESDKISTICFFGGEPFLEFDKILYTFNLCKKINLETGKKFAFSTITNGTLLHKYLSDLRDLINNNIFKFSINISFDGSFQYKRTKSKIVEENLDLLKKEHIPFGISYTILDYNSDPKVIVRDLVLIIKKYFSDDTNRNDKIRLNFDIKKIEDVSGETFNDYINNLKEYLYLLYLKYNIPFCHVVCDICRKCESSFRSDRETAMLNLMVPNSGIITKPDRTIGSFNLF